MLLNNVVSLALASAPLLAVANNRDSSLLKRADCKTTTVHGGDGCDTLAARCGLTGAKFTEYNPKLDCSKLVPDQWVCCSSGTLPSKRPNPNSDGSCFSVEVHDGDNCSAWVQKYDVTLTEIDNWNKKTWRWTGCQGLQPGMNVCLSSGTPPLPKTNSSIPCGLESPDNKECPLKACCGKWGYCGLTDEFCEENKGGAPGTGCQSNCGKLADYETKGGGASAPGRNVLGYYSNWAARRTCNGVPNTVLPAMRPSDLDPYAFSHIVYSFAGLSRGDWKLTETEAADKELIAELQGLKKKNPNLKTLWAVGGWAFNDPPTQDVFSTMASTQANRATFIKNVLSQLNAYGFDGIDIDGVSSLVSRAMNASDVVKEYPGTERGGIEADGKNFLALLKELRTAINNSGKRYLVTFTAPASYWYLQQFPIVDMSKAADWVNLMTYDIHGAWDIKFGTGVLPHTAIPEVSAAVNMFVKAGVSLSKVNLGLGFYGRSFTLANSGCSIAGCPMTGGGNPGPCTGESGFLAYGEIDYIMTSQSLKPEYNATSQTMVLKFGNQWIGYENPETIANKLKYVIKRGMPGVLIWAVDLDKNSQLINAVTGASTRPPQAGNDCLADGKWPHTPAGTTASIPCDINKKNGPEKTRKCGGPKWGDVEDKICSLDDQMVGAFGHCAGDL